jgi:uncharacterized protein YdeI (YjbR/CyaY-like superfamily)
VTWKKGRGRPVVPADDSSEEALCFGLVDSRPGSMDAERAMLLLTPRRPGSNWSRVNKERVGRLTGAGLMEPAGLAAVAAAKANGSWSALDEVEDLMEPDDLRRALDAEPVARRHWDAFPRSTRRAILEWIGTVRTEATREARVRRTVGDAAANVRANQWRQPTGLQGSGVNMSSYQLSEAAVRDVQVILKPTAAQATDFVGIARKGIAEAEADPGAGS